MDIHGEKVFFEIPIYRCSEEQHSTLMQQKRSQFSNLNDPSLHYFLDNIDITYQYWYNEVIGYICLYILGTQLRGFLFMDNRDRKRSGIRKKNYTYRDTLFRIAIKREMSSDEIFQKLLCTIAQINKRDFRKRYIHTEVLWEIGQFIDWRRLVDELDPFIQFDKKETTLNK